MPIVAFLELVAAWLLQSRPQVMYCSFEYIRKFPLPYRPVPSGGKTETGEENMGENVKEKRGDRKKKKRNVDSKIVKLI